MKTHDLKNQLEVINWFAVVGAKGRTPKNYLNIMQKYTDFNRMTPKELLNEALNDVDASGNMGRWEFPKRLTAFKAFLIKGGEYGVCEHNIDKNGEALRNCQ